MKTLHCTILILAIMTAGITTFSGLLIILDYIFDIFISIQTFFTLAITFIINSILFVICGTILWFIGICKPYNEDY